MCVLLVHPKPYEDESLANYLYRLTVENICKLKWILGDCRLKKGQEYLILNTTVEDKILDSVSEYTGLSKETLLKMTLNRFNYFHNEYFIDKISESSTNSKFCPLCLRENNYQRLFWQLKIVNICVKHKTILLDKCSCGRVSTIEAVITGKCICGRSLNRLKSRSNNYGSIYLNQIKVYHALGINLNTEHKEYCNNYISSFKNNSRYLILVDTLTKLTEIEKSTLGMYLNKYFAYPNLSSSVDNVLIVEKVLCNWPEGFYKLLDILNYKVTLVYDSGRDFDYLHNYNKISPALCLTEVISVEFLSCFKDEIYSYFISRYKNFYLEVFNVIKYSDIPFYKVRNVLKTEWSDIKGLSPLKDGFNIDYDSIHRILDYFMCFLEKGDLLYRNYNFKYTYDGSHEGLISLNDLYMFYKFRRKIKLDEILDIVREHNLYIGISVFQTGLNMIFLPETQLKEFINKKLSNASNKDKT